MRDHQKKEEDHEEEEANKESPRTCHLNPSPVSLPTPTRPPHPTAARARTKCFPSPLATTSSVSFGSGSGNVNTRGVAGGSEVLGDVTIRLTGGLDTCQESLASPNTGTATRLHTARTQTPTH
ncbi:hypothetical protein E2C01_099319 [Portunus trituberculatus]|uniref:Uncharacterized protein n=1 Tax=Portunus trituberculatus TaxID=210409 RepID=A0A5B7K019_PORTR|nr:hypothetical protein [Portunus trituberculatus]